MGFFDFLKGSGADEAKKCSLCGVGEKTAQKKHGLLLQEEAGEVLCRPCLKKERRKRGACDLCGAENASRIGGEHICRSCSPSNNV